MYTHTYIHTYMLTLQYVLKSWSIPKRSAVISFRGRDENVAFPLYYLAIKYSTLLLCKLKKLISFNIANMSFCKILKKYQKLTKLFIFLHKKLDLFKLRFYIMVEVTKMEQFKRQSRFLNRNDPLFYPAKNCYSRKLLQKQLWSVVCGNNKKKNMNKSSRNLQCFSKNLYY